MIIDFFGLFDEFILILSYFFDVFNVFLFFVDYFVIVIFVMFFVVSLDCIESFFIGLFRIVIFEKYYVNWIFFWVWFFFDLKVYDVFVGIDFGFFWRGYRFFFVSFMSCLIVVKFFFVGLFLIFYCICNGYLMLWLFNYLFRRLIYCFCLEDWRWLDCFWCE